MKTGEITRNDRLYPGLLKEIEDPPEKLYYRGYPEGLSGTCFAIVGSRKCSKAGVRAAKVLAGRLALCGVTVVSGMATGIDEAAHRGALDKGGKTIAVLGNGVDIAYPPHNKLLKGEIERNGCVISEYPDGTDPRKGYFPLRNRVISGLSEVVIVVEAARRSGSIITAEAAIEQGRKVFAVPGNFADPMYEGTDKLISDGAEPIYDVGLFLDSLGLKPKDTASLRADLSETENRAFGVISSSSELTQDQIAQELDMPVGKVSVIITSLELKGLITTELGKIFLTPDAF